MIANLRADAFAPLVETLCELIPDGGFPIPVTVIEVTENPRALPPRAPSGRRVPFSVLLTGPAESDFSSGSCTFRAKDRLTVEGLHVNRIVSLDGENDKAWYQIVFN
ncbi:MAG: hypothetical protein H7840_10610 [Alphaproteobacteria bacterium]